MSGQRGSESSAHATRRQRQLILASGSARRSELLRGLGLTFTVTASAVPETVPGQPTPDNLVSQLAERKARAVASTVAPGAVVIGADTVVALGGLILGKPRDADDAVRMLRLLSGRTHQVHSGVCVIDTLDGTTHRAVSATEVTVRPLDDALIQRYVATGEPLGKAGAYAIQGLGATLVTAIRGDYFTVVGLPLALLADLLAACDVQCL